MCKLNPRQLGSRTARMGFENEDIVVGKFNAWQKDIDAQEWLEIMGYKLKEIEKLIAKKLHGHKTDVQVQITVYLKEIISAENLSIKLVSNPQGFNQVDKRWVDTYVQMWNIPYRLSIALKLFTGEISHNVSGVRDPRRMYLNEMNSQIQTEIIKFFRDNKLLIVSDILKGSGKFPAGWMLVAHKKHVKGNDWALKRINHVLNVFGKGEVIITKKGNLRIGKIGMQRKGGDAGRKTANMLQFKINPVELFND